MPTQHHARQGVIEDLQADGSCGPLFNSGGCGATGQSCSGRLGEPWNPANGSTADGQLPSSAFMDTARHWGLAVHAWTLRQEV